MQQRILRALRLTVMAALPVTLSLTLSSCASRPGPDLLTTVAPQPGIKAVNVYVVTTRGRVDPKSNIFDTSKSPAANYGELKVSIPPDHKPSEIEWPDRKPDPRKSFAVVGQKVLDQSQFLRAVDSTAGPGPANVGVFVHGYNTNFQEALFRMAQLSADQDVRATPILFSWPSQGAVAGYVADKDAATYSRDYLAELMVELTRKRGTEPVMIFGHSMGGWLVMEALRQLKLEGRNDVLDRLSVILAAPDIDADVFRTQMRVIGKMKHPIRILVANDDRALALSKFISASSQRIGMLDVKDPAVQAAAVEAGVEIIDISGIVPTDSARHNRFADIKMLYPTLTAKNGKSNGLGQAGAFVFDAAAATISSPFRIVSGVLKQQ